MQAANNKLQRLAMLMKSEIQASRLAAVDELTGLAALPGEGDALMYQRKRAERRI